MLHFFSGSILDEFLDKSKFLDSIENGEGKVRFWGEKMNNSGPILDEFLDKSKFLDSSENEEGKNEFCGEIMNYSCNS